MGKGNRLQFELFRGVGPPHGWASIELKREGKVLLCRKASAVCQDKTCNESKFLCDHEVNSQSLREMGQPQPLVEERAKLAVDDIICCSKQNTVASSRKRLHGEETASDRDVSHQKLRGEWDILNFKMTQLELAAQLALKHTVDDDSDCMSTESTGKVCQASEENKSLNELQIEGPRKQPPGKKKRVLPQLPSIALAAVEKQLGEPLSPSHCDEGSGMLCDERLLLRTSQKRPL